MLNLQKPTSENNDITTIRTPSESHLPWRDQFHKNPLFSRINADFEADNEIDDSSIGDKTTNIVEQIPVCIGYRIESELNDNLNCG